MNPLLHFAILRVTISFRIITIECLVNMFVEMEIIKELY